jgi:site-specific DNA recombinase
MIAIYVRLSREDDESNSIDNQKREGKAFAKSEPFEIYNEGQGVSGRNEIKDRPELLRLMSDMNAGKINKVWFRNQNRLERSGTTFAFFAKAVIENKVEVYFADKLQDFNDPTTKLHLQILSNISEYQANLQGFQTKKSLLDNAKEGKTFGVTPYGYKNNGKDYLEIDEDEAKVVKRIYKLSLHAIGTKSIAEKLNEEGIPTRYNKISEGTISTKNRYTDKVTVTDKNDVRWAGNTIRGIITNPMYKGLRVWNRHDSKENRKAKKEGKPLDPEILIPLPHLEIIEPHYWQKVKDNLSNNRNNKGKSVDHKYMLKGLLECSDCGRNYYGRTRQNKKDNYYMCSSKRYKHEKCTNKSINIDVLESLIWHTMFEDDSLFDKMVKVLQEGGTADRKKELDDLISLNKKNIKKLSDESNRNVTFLVKGTLNEEQFNAEKLRITRAEIDIQEQMNKDKEELGKLQDETALMNDITADWNFPKTRVFYDPVGLEPSKELKEKIRKLTVRNERYRHFNPSWNEKRNLIHKYVQRIFLKYDSDSRIYVINIHYKLPIEDETYLLDSNYIGAYNYKAKILTDWQNENMRTFKTMKKINTHRKLEDYTIG